jgi:hypothetical protein
VTTTEVEFKKEKGIDEFEAGFEELELDYLNPERESVL